MRNPFSPYLLPLAVAFACYYLSKTWSCRSGRLANGLCAIAVLLIGVGLSLPSVARVSVYYQGKSQFEWADALESGNPAIRGRAIEALCQLITQYPHRHSVQSVAAYALVRAKATETIPFLRSLLAEQDVGSNRNLLLQALEQLEGAARQENRAPSGPAEEKLTVDKSGG
jgi:hypothetical protein